MKDACNDCFPRNWHDGSTFSSPDVTNTHSTHTSFHTTAGETITQKSKSMRTSGTSSMNHHVRPESVTSRGGFTSMAEQQHYFDTQGTRKSLEFLPPLRGGGGAMPASRNPFRRSSDSTTRMRPLSSNNPFDAAIKAVEETMSSTTTRPLFVPRRQSPFSPTSLSLKGDEIRRLLAANQNGSIASSPLSMSTSGMTGKNPFALPERIVSRGFPSLPSRRGLKLPQRHMMESSSEFMNDFSFHSPTVVDVDGSLCLRRPTSGLVGNKQRGDLAHSTRGLKRASDESSYSDDSSCGSRKQARRLNAMHVSDKNVANGRGFDRFRNRNASFNQQPSPVASSQPKVPQVVKTVNRSRAPPPLRFFNNGVECDIEGNPIVSKQDDLPRLDSEPEEQADFDTLQNHQKSIWDELIETPEQQEAREKKQARRNKRTASAEKEPTKPLNLPIDPTASEFQDRNKLDSAKVEDLVRDSLKEREKTLSAASVLMGLLGQEPNKEKTEV